MEEIFCDLNVNTQQYARAIGIEVALDCDDTYAYQRTNQGKNYSPLVLLRGVEEIDRATQDIASCVRNWFTDPIDPARK